MVTANKQTLLLEKKRLSLSQNGHKLLKKKHDSLVKQVIEMIKESVELRKKFNVYFKNIEKNYSASESSIDKEYLEVLSSTSPVKTTVSKSNENIMGVVIPKLGHTLSGDLKSYSLVNTNMFLDLAIDDFKELLPLLFKLTELENACYLILEEVDSLKKRISGLENRIIPQHEDNIKQIKLKLAEKELQQKVLLIKIKEKILNK